MSESCAPNGNNGRSGVLSRQSKALATARNTTCGSTTGGRSLPPPPGFWPGGKGELICSENEMQGPAKQRAGVAGGVVHDGQSPLAGGVLPVESAEQRRRFGAERAGDGPVIGVV